MSKKLRQTNIILANLTESKLKIILELCEREKIHFTFDKDYYSNEYYDIIFLVDNIVTKNKEIPKIFKKLIENEYSEYLEDNNESEKLEKIKQIKYVEE
jgi:hypothetical protein